jgi:hypothetical protein
MKLLERWDPQHANPVEALMRLMILDQPWAWRRRGFHPDIINLSF